MRTILEAPYLASLVHVTGFGSTGIQSLPSFSLTARLSTLTPFLGEDVFFSRYSLL